MELLLSMATAVLLLTLLYSIYHTVARTAQSQEQRRATQDPAIRARATLTSDARGMFLPQDDDACRLQLKAHNEQPDLFDELSLCRTLPATGNEDLRWTEVRRVVHRVVARPGGRNDWIREVHALQGPDVATGPATNLVLAGVARFKVAVHDGHDWSSAWPPDERDAQPRALRVEWATHDAEEVSSVEVVVPAGHFTVEPAGDADDAVEK